MSKFNRPVRSQVERMKTHEGGAAWRFPVVQELAFTAACTYTNEDTFYESKNARMARLAGLVRDATDRDPAGVGWFVIDLRERFKIRGASILVAAEYARRRQETDYPGSRAPTVADVVDWALQRGDEPAEFVAYWQQRFGTERLGGGAKAHLPKGVRKGLARAVQRLYTERTALKWDSRDRQVRMGDVIELCHPKAVDTAQSALFRFLLDERHHGDGYDRYPKHLLPMIDISYDVGRVPTDRRRTLLRESPKTLHAAGYTWERLSGWLPGGMDAEAWESIIPSMGVMALLKNLRNFDQAGISHEAVDYVIEKITNQRHVTESKIMPYRVLQAYQHAPSDDWQRALMFTLDRAVTNLTPLDDALVVLDISLSMLDPVSGRSVMRRVDLAALQALALAKASSNADVVVFAEGSERLDRLVPGWRSWSTLHAVDAVSELVRRQPVGAGTWGNTAIMRSYDLSRHRHVVVFTDGQMHDDAALIGHVPSVITFNIGGYQPVSTWGRGRINVAGYSDQVYAVVAELLHARDGSTDVRM